MTASSDPSLRFVVPEDAPFLKNLAALWAAEPKLASAIEATDEHAAPEDPTSIGRRGSYHVEKSRSGEPTLCAALPDKRRLYLHSRYEPLAEAIKLIDAVNTSASSAFHVQGFGLGYHVETLLDRTGDDAIVCILEPDLRVLRAAFEQRDLSRLIRAGRVIWFWQADKADLFSRLMPWQPLISMGFDAVVHAPSVQLAPQFHQQMRTWIDEFKAYARTTISTLVLNGRRTAENIAANIPWYIATPSLSRLSSAYRGAPAIIVSAGPSLRKNKHLLKDAAGKAVIIAVQTTLQPLLEIGIEPHFVTSLDYHEISTRFWESLPPSLKTELIAEPKASSAIFELNPGPLSLIGNDYAENLLAEMNLNKAKLPSGATVAHLAYYLAEFLGCDPIIFVGQDLGFSEGLCYAPGTSYDDVWRPELGRFCTVEMKQWEHIVRDRAILRKVPDCQGRPMYTEERLFTYLQHFERDFARSKARIIDATEGGALKRGTSPMRLADAIAQFCTKPLGTWRHDHPGLDWRRLDEAVASLRARRHEAEQIKRISRETLPLLEEVRDHLDDQPRVNRLIARLDALRAQMVDLSTCYSAIMQLSQKTELNKFNADRRILAEKLEGTERQRRQVVRDIDNVRAVLEASQQFQQLMDDTIARTQSFRSRQRREAA